MHVYTRTREMRRNFLRKLRQLLGHSCTKVLLWLGWNLTKSALNSDQILKAWLNESFTGKVFKQWYKLILYSCERSDSWDGSLTVCVYDISLYSGGKGFWDALVFMTFASRLGTRVLSFHLCSLDKTGQYCKTHLLDINIKLNRTQVLVLAPTLLT